MVFKWQATFSKHKFSEGESICTCTFRVLWQHGPMAGEKSIAGVENICLPQSKNVENQTLNHFLDIARRKLEETSIQVDPAISPFRATPMPLREAPSHETESVGSGYEFSTSTVVAGPGGTHGSIVDHCSKKPQKSFLYCKVQVCMWICMVMIHLI